MPDKWEYPWYASWDLAFHCIPLALVDPHFAKGQLDLIMREWYQHPNGQMPAYEWNFSDVNPPVIALGGVARLPNRREADRQGRSRLSRNRLPQNADRLHLVGESQGLRGQKYFPRRIPRARQHRRLRSQRTLPDGGHLEQSDGTSWMGMFSLNMMRMALELARENPVYENIATKFFEHFLGIAAAMNNLGGKGIGLWDETDEFYYDVLQLPAAAICLCACARSSV